MTQIHNNQGAMNSLKLFAENVDWNKLIREWSASSTIRGRYEVRSIARIIPPVILILLIVAGLKLYSERYVVAALLAFFSVLVWLLGRHIVQTQTVRPFVLLLLLLGIGIITVESLLFDSLRPNIAAPILPVVAYFYLGLRVGTLLSSCLLVHILLLMFVFNPVADVQNAMNVVICFVMITIVSRLYEMTRLKTEQELDQLSNTDVLTGAANRRVLDKVLSREIKRARRELLPLCVFMMDVDNFKQINDSKGHHAGDQVLKSICQLIQRNIRSTDCLIRYGGDEFVIITPATDYQHARRVVDKISEEISQFDFGIGQSVEASIGIAEFDPEDNIDRLLSRADQALYRVKSRRKVELVSVSS